VLVSVMNTGGNKLDQFVSVDSAIEVDSGGSGAAVTMRLDITNDAPVGEPPYVLGPFPGTGLGEGVYRGIVAVEVPGAATDVRIEGGEGQVAAGPDGPARVIATTAQLARGERRRVTIRFRLPATVDELLIEPSARQPPIRWHWGDRTWVDDHAERLEW
jgi:hypothetical protein